MPGPRDLVLKDRFVIRLLDDRRRIEARLDIINYRTILISVALA